VPQRPKAFLRAIGALVRQARERRGWSQETLAAEAGLDRSYMSGVERGVRNPSVLKLEAIARALHVSARDLLPADRTRTSS
jgi:transcriptional regulator with XRE-family HTH domain